MFEAHLRRITRLLYVIASSPYAGGIKGEIEEFFSFEDEIDNFGKGKPGEKVDPLANEGEWIIDKNGEKQWVYNFEAIQNIRNFLNRFNSR